MTRLAHILPILIVLVLVTACTPAQSAPTPTATATPTPFPTFAFIQYTTVPEVAAAGTAAAAATAAAGSDFDLDAEKAERGLGRWEALECGSCHGAAGEGTDDGPPLTDYTVAEADFVEFMRTGGELGNDHRYPAESLSNSGISNLYHYVRSLGE